VPIWDAIKAFDFTTIRHLALSQRRLGHGSFTALQADFSFP
jgi:hypothetical protein